jgi:membrane carboxypeptidase/penicillin-binding protein
VYRHRASPVALAGGDRAAFYQLRTILEGVVTRGTATSMKQHATYIGGKTGTTDNENDAWFVGFTSDVTVAVWVGYDNAGGKRTLGNGETGGKVAVPIVEPIFQASWLHHAPKTPLPAPTPEAARHLRPLPIDVNTGQKVAASKGAFMEYFRADGGRVRDTQHAMVSRGQVAMRPAVNPANDERGTFIYPGPNRQAPPPPSRPPRTLRELFGLQRY